MSALKDEETEGSIATNAGVVGGVVEKRFDLPSAKQVSLAPGQTNATLVKKDTLTDPVTAMPVFNESESLTRPATLPTRAAALPPLASRPSKELVASPPIEKSQKGTHSKAPQSTKEASTNFLASESAGRSSDTLADSKKILLSESFSELQTAEIRPLESPSALMPAARWKEPPRARSIFSREAVEAAQSSQSTSSVYAVAQPTATSIAASLTDVYVAEQVSYWISRDVQKAEMKLDGFGSDPVQVNISMNGNEAQVVFRTDELQFRNALENAGVYLKEMLLQEGVVLSGVSVGSNRSGESGSQDGRQRPSVRQASVNVVQTLQPNQHRESSPVAGRSLDLFV